MAGHDLIIQQGSTFTQVLRWETPPVIYKPITAISQVAPVLITAPSHGIPKGWRVVVVSAKGMTQINAKNTPPRNTDYNQATVVSADQISLNGINAADFSPYVSGGYLQFNTPTDLTAYTARMSIKDVAAVPNYLMCIYAGTTGSAKPTAGGTDGTAVWAAAPANSVRTITWAPNTAVSLNAVMDTHELLRLDTTNARIVLNTTEYTITLTIDAATTAAQTWINGVYDLELVSASGVVTGLLHGVVTVVREVTT
jgi:hypothetical protein